MECWITAGPAIRTPDTVGGSVRRWWQHMGQPRYPKAKRLVVTADAGGSNGPRIRLWRVELQRLR